MISSKVNSLSLILVSSLAVAMTSVGCSNAVLKAMVIPFPTVTVEIQNYCPFYDPNTANRKNFVYRDIFVFNSSADFNGTNWTTDYDRDGLSDTFELLPLNVNAYPISWTSAYTDNDGYSDLVKVRSGVQIGTTMPGCTSFNDTDGDGLTDCEENFLGLTTTNPDSDGDGIPDYVEFRFGMNALDANDAYGNVSGDTISNYQKAKWGVPVSNYMTSASIPLMVSYTTATLPGITNPTGNCYTFDISNVPVLPVVNGNLVQIQVVEDNQYPATQGINPLDRELRTHRVLLPESIQSGVKVIVVDGVGISNSLNTNGSTANDNTGIVDGGNGPNDRPLVIVGGT